MPQWQRAPRPISLADFEIVPPWVLKPVGEPVRRLSMR